jgi:cytochrome c oxidase accessory protein FixG
MMFDFYFFREQLCLIACPYGRFQSVLLDKWSLIVSYDRKRGEPRGKIARTVSLPLSPQGDCVDCGLCVTTCPTGIDIRAGLQMECVSCTQCIDACDAVMEKIGKPKGLIRYGSQAGMSGEKKKLLRPRVIFYPLILLILVVAWALVFAGKGEVDVSVLRNYGSPYVRLEGGRIGNPLQLKLVNRSDHEATYHFAISQPAGAVIEGNTEVTIPAGQSQTVGFVVSVPADVFAQGMSRATFQVSTRGADGQETVAKEAGVTLVGPIHVSTGARP